LSVVYSGIGLVASENMVLNLLQIGEGGNACLDGSPFGYYLQRNTSSSSWVIDIAGGGWCDSVADCATRSIRLASSTTWDATRNGVGITSDNAQDNPAFHTYNHVYFPYCDGSSFTSFRDKPLATNKKTRPFLHMRGRANLAAALASLQRDHGMTQVDDIIVTGGSAGALTVFLHIDAIAGVVKPKHAFGLPDGGAFRPTEKGCCKWQDIVELHNSLAGLPSGCTSEQPSDLAWKCFTVPTLQPFVQTPLFVLQSQFDHFQLRAMAGISCAKSQVFFPPWKSVKCSTADLAAIASYGSGWFDDFHGLLHSPNVGAFVTACMAHEERASWTSLVAGGATLHDAFAEWHGSLSKALAPRRHWIVNCSLPCNPNTKLCAPGGFPPPSPPSPPTPLPTPAPGASNSLLAPGWLEAGHTLISQSGAVRLAMQASDGNLVLYHDTSTGTRVVWASNTGHHSGAHLRMRMDGKLVLYTADGQILWSSSIQNGATMAVVTNSCDLVLTDDVGNVVWALRGTDCHAQGATQAIATSEMVV